MGNYERAAFYATFDRIVPAANKYMATLFNTSTVYRVVLEKIFAFNWQVTAVVGLLLEQYLAFITARTVGTSITIRPFNSGDALPAGITGDHNSSLVTERDIIERFFALNEEMILAAANLLLHRGTGTEAFNCIYKHPNGVKGLTLRTNEGVSIRNVTTSTVGSCSYLFMFSLDPG